MSDLLKVIVGLFLWFLSFLLMYYVIWRPNCARMPFCNPTTIVANVPPPSKKETIIREPLDCQWANATPSTNDGFEDFRQGILARAGEGEILEIVGLYYADEENNSTYDDMGLARANQIKTLFLEVLTAERIKIRSTQLSFSDDAQKGYHACAEFHWLPGERGPVEILEDRAIIRFPYNSVEKEFDPKIDAYLEKLAQQLKESGETVHLTGHTDDRGSAERNEILAHRRAKMIRDELRRKGVKRRQIKTFTKGEMEPISTNDTQEGRHQNRRVEVQVMP